MSLDYIKSLRGDSPRRRIAELAAIIHAVRPVALDFASTFLFYFLLMAGADARIAAIVGVGLGVGQIVFMLMCRQRPSAMQIGSVVLVMLVGVVTLLTNDARIVFWKVSVIYLVLGCTMLRPGWMQRYIPPIAAEHLPPKVMIPWERIWAVLIMTTGLLSLVLSLTQSARVTATIFGIFAPVSKIVLFSIQYIRLRHRTLLRMQAQLEAAA